ncbi:MAG: hypothetical protein ACOYLB_01480 [Phototrophicaceae bacterium]
MSRKGWFFLTLPLVLMIALVSWVMLDASPTAPTPPTPPTRKRNIRRTVNATPYGDVVLQEPNGGEIDLTLNSTVQGNVSLHSVGGAVQTVIHSDIQGDVHAHSAGGSVAVIVRDGAHITGTIHADAPQSTLQVAFTLQSWDEFYSVQTLLAHAQPQQGEVVIHGHTLRWKNFKQIDNCTRLVLPIEPHFMS